MRKIRVTTAALARSPALTLAKLVLDVSVNHAVYGQCLDNDADGLEDNSVLMITAAMAM